MQPPTTLAIAALENIASESAYRPAICRSEGTNRCWYSWLDLGAWIDQLVIELDAEQLPQGSHIASAMPNSVEWIVLDLACQVLGLVHVAIDTRWPIESIVDMVQRSRSKLLYLPAGSAVDRAAYGLGSISREQGGAKCHESREKSLASFSLRCLQIDWHAPAITDCQLLALMRRAAAVSGSSAAQMLFTSGTTGHTKGVLLSHRNLVSNALAKLEAAPQQHNDLRLNVLPFSHAYARTCELSSWLLTGGQLAIADNWLHFLQLAPLVRPTLINLVPHLVGKLMQPQHTSGFQCTSGSSASATVADADEIRRRLGDRVRLLQVGGAALPETIWEHLAQCGLAPLQGYGLTEASPVVCSNRAGQQRPGTVGQPVRGVELRVDELGQLWVRGENVMLGYFDAPEETAQRIQKGWLATGDLVSVESNGHYRIVGRMSEQIVLSTAFKVSPELVESRLMSIEGVEQAMAFGQDRPCIVALVWLKDSVQSPTSLDDILPTVDRIFEDLPAYMRPAKIGIVAERLDSRPELLNGKGQPNRSRAWQLYHHVVDHADGPRVGYDIDVRKA